MRQPVFSGTCTAIITPFDKNGTIDYPAFAALVEEQIAAGIDAICVCGTTGESATLSPQEHRQLVESCVRTADHRVKVIAGTGSNDTAKAIALSQSAQSAGADALLVVTPYYNKTTQSGLIEHYEAIADHVDLPIILYNVPSRTGVGFTAETYRVLAQNPRINGVKEASGDLSLAAHTRALCGEDFSIWSGNDDQVVPMMSLGARGVVSVASNLIPETMTELSHLCLKGDYPAAARLQLSCLELMDALFLEVNPIPIKTAMELTGKCGGALRLPLCQMTPEHRERLRSVMAACQLLPSAS